MHKEYIIFSDESEANGRFYSNFYGGLLVGSSDYEAITNALELKKRELNFYAELKWSKVSAVYREKYEEFIRYFFEFVRLGKVKVRIMFRQNAREPRRLTRDDLELAYFKLYYQFIKHGFDLMHREPRSMPVRLRLYFDQFPDTREKSEQFKGYLLGLGRNREMMAAGITLEKEDVTEVRSHDHVLLQCLDVVLGAMAFRLNEKHKDKPEGARMRGRRTIAKEKLYKTILNEIRSIHPNFNIGISTGCAGSSENRWHHPYRHWCFEPADSIFRSDLTKGSKRKGPIQPT